jgi:hypothetical protein
MEKQNEKQHMMNYCGWWRNPAPPKGWLKKLKP